MIVAVLLVPILCAAQPNEPTPPKTLDGYLGIGARQSSNYVGGAGRETQLVPLLQFEYQEMFYVFLDRAGVRLWNSADKKVALGIAAEPRFGFRAADGPRLHDMATRHDRIEGGPSLEWETPILSFNLAYFTDWTGAGGGQSLRFAVFHQLLDNTRWDVVTFAGLERDSAKTVRYYFGVRTEEATSERPSYQPGASLNPLLGFSAAYKFNQRYAVLFGTNATFLGAAAANSPIVERRRDVTSYLGLGRVF